MRNTENTIVFNKRNGNCIGEVMAAVNIETANIRAGDLVLNPLVQALQWVETVKNIYIDVEALISTPIIVTELNGVYRIVKGACRLTAYIERQGKDALVPCTVYHCDTEPIENLMFCLLTDV